MLFLDHSDWLGDWFTAYRFSSPAPDETAEQAHAAAISKNMARVIPAASESDVPLEQFEQLLEHVKHGTCGCSLCLDYAVIREKLMKPFHETAKLLASVAQR